MTSTTDTVFAIAAFAIAAWIDPHSAVGATFGSAFFLLSADHHPTHKRIGYAVISAVVGYAAGLAAPDTWAMLASAVTAAIAVVSITALSRSIESEGLGALRSIVDIIRGRK